MSDALSARTPIQSSTTHKTDLQNLADWEIRISLFLEDGQPITSWVTGIYRPHLSVWPALMRLSIEYPQVLQQIRDALREADRCYERLAGGPLAADEMASAMEFLARQIRHGVEVISRATRESPSAATSSGGRSAVPKWQQARNAMLKRLKAGSLPKSLRETGRVIGFRYSTVRDAALRSPSLVDHFRLKREASDPNATPILDELILQADARTAAYLKELHEKVRIETEAALREMLPEQRSEILMNLSHGDAGEGHLSLIEGADQDARSG